MANNPPTHFRPRGHGLRWRSTIASVAALVWIVAADTSLRTRHRSPRTPGSGSNAGNQANYLRTSSSTSNHGQWRTQRKQPYYGNRVLYKKGEWEEDDDFDPFLPFHLEDDDANHSDSEVQSATNATQEQKGSSDLEKEEAIPGKGNADEGIIYSDNVGSKESDPLTSPKKPPPPPPREKKSNNQKGDTNKNGTQKEDKPTDGEETDISAAIHTTNTTTHNKSNNMTAEQNYNKNEQQQQSSSSSTTINDEEDDSIFDDLARGFTISSLFCVALVILHKCCWYLCVRCRFFPDERVLEARWRRWQLKKKRSYNKANYINGSDAPLDTRKWGEWMAKRELVEGADDGCYYSGALDEYGSDVWDDDSVSIVGGAILFEDVNGELEMGRGEWGSKSRTNASGMELEFGEGIELEDKSHDSRMFDIDDKGLACEMEADKFFDGHDQQKKGESAKGRVSKVSQVKQVLLDFERNDDDSDDKSNNKKDASSSSNKSEISDDSFFDALQPPSGENTDDPLLDSQSNGNENDDDIEPPQDVVDLLGDGNIDTKEVNEEQDVDNDERNETLNGGFRSSMLLKYDDGGYDEMADLLGLRSDSPPPLDLEEIEKKVKENMESAKLY